MIKGLVLRVKSTKRKKKTNKRDISRARCLEKLQYRTHQFIVKTTDYVIDECVRGSLLLLPFLQLYSPPTRRSHAVDSRRKTANSECFFAFHAQRNYCASVFTLFFDTASVYYGLSILRTYGRRDEFFGTRPLINSPIISRQLFERAYYIRKYACTTETVGSKNFRHNRRRVT